MLAGLLSPDVSFLGLQMAIFPLCLRMLFLLCVSILISSYKNAGRIGSEPILVTLLNSNHLLNEYFQIQSYSEALEVRISMYEFGKHNSAHNTDFHFPDPPQWWNSTVILTVNALFEDVQTSKSQHRNW